jgi:succinate dehydrogenase / fumarate reductase cytochrome b subunit
MYTMVLSISHRITGIALTVAFVAFAWWLVALAIGPESYDRAASALGSPFGLLVLAGFVLAYWYHFCAGIRHLVWDTGHMLEKPAARRSAVFVLAATVVLTLLTYWAMYALAARAGGAE